MVCPFHPVAAVREEEEEEGHVVKETFDCEGVHKRVGIALERQPPCLHSAEHEMNASESESG